MGIGEAGTTTIIIAKVNNRSRKQLGESLKGGEGPRVRDKGLNKDYGRFCPAQKPAGLFKNLQIRLGRR